MKEKQLTQDWYRKEREDLAKSFEMAKRDDEELESHLSPSGKYRLEITSYDNGTYSQGKIQYAQSEELITVVVRNYGHFPFAWCEGHPSGHDYLICGEDYQGQTIIELDTGQRVDFIPDEAEQGHGFCGVAFYPAPDGRYLFVDGCFWGCPYELILFDFSKPLILPYQELNRWLVNEVQGFQPDGSFLFNYAIEIRLSDGKPLGDFTDAEWNEFNLNRSNKELYGRRIIRVKWNSDGTTEEIPIEK